MAKAIVVPTNPTHEALRPVKIKGITYPTGALLELDAKTAEKIDPSAVAKYTVPVTDMTAAQLTAAAKTAAAQEKAAADAAKAITDAAKAVGATS